MSGTTEADDAPAPPPARPWLVTVRRFLTLFMGEGVARALSLVTVLLLARRLGPSGFGVVAFGVALVTWFGLVADAGTEMLTTRDVSRRPGRFKEIAEPVVGLRLALSLVAAAALIVGIALFARSPVNAEVYLLFVPVLPAVALNVRWMTLGVGGARYIAAGNVTGQAVLLLGVIVLTRQHDDIRWVPPLYAAAELAYAAVILAGLYPRFGLIRPRVDLDRWRLTLRGGAPLMVSSFARGVLMAFDVLVITVALGPHATGQYSAASRPVLFVITGVGLFFFSFVASYSALTGSAAQAMLRTSVRSTAAASIVVALALAAGAPFLVDLLFGSRYGDAVVLLAILAWKIPFSAMASPFNGALIATGRQRLVMRNNLIGAGVNVVLAVTVVGVAGVEGVAVVSVVSVALLLLLSVRAAVGVGASPPLRALLGGGKGRE